MARICLQQTRDRLKLPGEEIDVGALSRDALQRQAQAAIAAIAQEADGARQDE
jgi:hypothetical protein